MEHLVPPPDGVHSGLHVERVRIAERQGVVTLESGDGVKRVPAVSCRDVQEVDRALLVDEVLGEGLDDAVEVVLVLAPGGDDVVPEELPVEPHADRVDGSYLVVSDVLLGLVIQNAVFKNQADCR